jgi:hypothetical protein
MERMLEVVGFSISPYASCKRPKRSLDPLLGETYELVHPEKGFRLISEHVRTLSLAKSSCSSQPCFLSTFTVFIAGSACCMKWNYSAPPDWVGCLSRFQDSLLSWSSTLKGRVGFWNLKVSQRCHSMARMWTLTYVLSSPFCFLSSGK